MVRPVVSIGEGNVLCRRPDARWQRSMAFAGYPSVQAALGSVLFKAPSSAAHVVMISNHGELCQMNLVAGFLWEALDGQRSVGELAASVAHTFAVDAATAVRDARDVLGRLAELGLVIEATGAAK